MIKINQKKLLSKILVAIEIQSPLNKDKKLCCENFEEKNKIYWVIDSTSFCSSTFHKKIRDFFANSKGGFDVDLDSFLNLFKKENSQGVITSIFSAHEIAFHLPFNLQSKKKPETVINFLVNEKKYLHEINFAKTLIDAENFARKLQIMPSNYLNSEKFLSEIQKQFKTLNKVKITSIGKSALQKKKMNLILAVAKASDEKHEPKLITIEYNGKQSEKTKLAFVGKGILFDTGGISLKPANYMLQMHYDMSGAAIVAATIYAYAKLKLPINIVGVLPLVNNDIGPSGVRLNDIITSYSKQTVEITNSDAEGRLILADSITYCINDLKVKNVLTIATLTGAADVALGDTYTPIWTTNNNQWDLIQTAALNGFESVWHMPLHGEYADKLKISKVADFVNSESSRSAGSSVAAQFLSFFAPNINFIHCDIAASSEYKKMPIPVMLKTLFFFGKDFK